MNSQGRKEGGGTLAGTGLCTCLLEQRCLQLSTPSHVPGSHAGLECQGTFICKASWRRRLRKRAADPRWAVPQSLEGEPGCREDLLGPSGSKDFQEDGGLAGSPSLCELQAGALSSREHVGGVGWAGVGEAERADGACRLLPWLLGRAGAWALSSRSTARTLRWRSRSTSGQQGGEALRPGAPGLTLAPTSTLPENVLSVFSEPQEVPGSNQLRAGSLHPGQDCNTAFQSAFLCSL